MLICVDPGKHTGGLAIFRDRKLVLARLIRCSGPESRHAIEFARKVYDAYVEMLGVEADDLYCEYPVVRLHSKGKDPNNLRELCSTVGAVEFALQSAKPHRIKPEDWKSNIDADICCARVKARLHDDELAVFAQSGALKSNEDHVLDAIGVGMYVLGRIGRGATKGLDA